jgi:biopolymer transport protein ExbD
MFSSVVDAAIHPPPPAHHEDETHLDFNALIDVCLVLLIFFIIISAVVKLQLRLEAPNITGEDAKGPLVVTKEQVDKTMLVASVKMENGRPVTRIEGKEVSGDEIKRELRRYVRSSGKTQLLLDHDAKVPYGAVVAVQDAARSVGVDKVWLLVQEDELPKRPEGAPPGE